MDEKENKENNIIEFPYRFVSEAPITIEQSQSYIENIRYQHINDAIEVFTEIFFYNIESASFNLEKADPKTVGFFLESLKSMLCSCYSLEHPFQELSEDVFVENDGILSLNSNVFGKPSKDDIEAMLKEHLDK